MLPLQLAALEVLLLVLNTTADWVVCRVCEERTTQHAFAISWVNPSLPQVKTADIPAQVNDSVGDNTSGGLSLQQHPTCAAGHAHLPTASPTALLVTGHCMNALLVAAGVHLARTTVNGIVMRGFCCPTGCALLPEPPQSHQEQSTQRSAATAEHPRLLAA